MKKYNKTCIVCRKKYTFCTGCSEYDHLPRWMAIYHDANCREIFNTVSAFLDNQIAKDEAKSKLDECDLTNKEHFHNVILNAINDLYNDTVDSSVDDTNINSEEVSSIVEENTEENLNADDSEKPVNKSKKKKV